MSTQASLPKLDSTSCVTVIGNGRVSDGVFYGILPNACQKSLNNFVDEGSHNYVSWHPLLSRHADGAPKVRVANREPSKDKRFKNRDVLSPEQEEAMVQALAHHDVLQVIVNSEAGPSAGVRMLQGFGATNLGSRKYRQHNDWSNDHLHQAYVGCQMHGNREDKDFVNKKTGQPENNDVTVETVAKMWVGFDLDYLVMSEPHSYSVLREMKAVLEPHGTKVLAQSFMHEAITEVKAYMDKKYGGVNPDTTLVKAPDGGMKHFIGCAWMIGFLNARGIDVPAPGPYDDSRLDIIHETYLESYKFYSENPEISYDFRHDGGRGPHSAYVRSWVGHQLMFNLDPNALFPMRIEDAPPTFGGSDKNRVNGFEVDGQWIMHGDPKGRLVISFDDISFSVGTMFGDSELCFEAGATSFIPVLMHMDPINLGHKGQMAKIDGYKNGLYRMLDARGPSDDENNAFRFEHCFYGGSIPSSEKPVERFLNDNPGLANGLTVFDVGPAHRETIAHLSGLTHFDTPNPNFREIRLPEDVIADTYGFDPNIFHGINVPGYLPKYYIKKYADTAKQALEELFEF